MNQKFSVTVLVIKLMNLQYNMEVAIGSQGVGLTVMIFQVNRLILENLNCYQYCILNMQSVEAYEYYFICFNIIKEKLRGKIYMYMCRNILHFTTSWACFESCACALGYNTSLSRVHEHLFLEDKELHCSNSISWQGCLANEID